RLTNNRRLIGNHTRNIGVAELPPEVVFVEGHKHAVGLGHTGNNRETDPGPGGWHEIAAIETRITARRWGRVFHDPVDKRMHQCAVRFSRRIGVTREHATVVGRAVGAESAGPAPVSATRAGITADIRRQWNIPIEARAYEVG